MTTNSKTTTKILEPKYLAFDQVLLDSEIKVTILRNELMKYIRKGYNISCEVYAYKKTNDNVSTQPKHITTTIVENENGDQDVCGYYSSENENVTKTANADLVWSTSFLSS